jgi:hypothetical protein
MTVGGHDERTMSDTHDPSHAADEAHGSEPDPGAHGDVHDAHGDGHDAHGDGLADAHDPHGHVTEPLAGIGWAMWGAGILGIAAALVITAAFVVATGFNLST